MSHGYEGGVAGKLFFSRGGCGVGRNYFKMLGVFYQ